MMVSSGNLGAEIARRCKKTEERTFLQDSTRSHAAVARIDSGAAIHDPNA